MKIAPQWHWSLFFHPKYWLLWVGLGVLWLAVQLPYSWQMTMGRYLGRVALPFARHRRLVAQVNLKLCFPTLSVREHRTLLKLSFESAGMAIFETGMAWWMPKKRLMRLIRIEGLSHLQEVLAMGRGALILAAHFTTLELGGRILSLYTPYNGVYRQHKNSAFEWLMHKTREKHIREAIARNDVRHFLRSFKENIPVFYAADQDYGRKHSVFVPFFGTLAATITGTSRITKIARTSVLPYFVHRTSKGYVAAFQPPLANFPTDDFYQDATRINQLIEAAILKSPEQYLWQHRRFKTRPEGGLSVYSAL